MITEEIYRTIGKIEKLFLSKINYDVPMYIDGIQSLCGYVDVVNILKL